MTEEKTDLPKLQTSTKEWLDKLMVQARNQTVNPEEVSESLRISDREVTYDKFINFCNKFPQWKNKEIQYVFVKGWSRELALQADRILPIDSHSQIKTKLNVSFAPTEIKSHGDIDICLVNRDLEKEIIPIWRQYNIDENNVGKTLPDFLLYKEQDVEQSLRDYFCVVEFDNRDFIVPKPEVIFLANTHKNSEGNLRRPNVLRSLNEKYVLDLNLIDQIRKIPGVEKFIS
ncbi:MAG: hypothetical protein ABSE04_00530 [Candidatus Microgenomates bacterium]|jgi:hypothetical protein